MGINNYRERIESIPYNRVIFNIISKNYDELHEALSRLELVNLELEKTNYDLLQFASVVSHDLKEPLRKVQTFAGLLKETVSRKWKVPIAARKSNAVSNLSG